MSNSPSPSPSPSLPDTVERGLVHALGERVGRTPAVTRARAVSGGCINSATRVELDSGEVVFLKWKDGCPADFFLREAEGLEALSAGPLRVPELIGTSGASAPGPAWLALEYVAPGPPAGQYDELLGAGLAAIHEAPLGGDAFGWATDNYIGSLPQANGIATDWPFFWRDRRLIPQLDQARPTLDRRDLERFDVLLGRLDDLLATGQDQGSSLLHGDLWSGNVFAGPGGEPVLVDPSVYRGHNEVDLAMTELFGGFGPGFYEAYERVRPLRAGYAECRRHVYQLYPLLVHVNLFGGGYVDGLRRALAGALSAG